MDEYTAIIHKKNGNNIQSDFMSPDDFTRAMDSNKDHVVWGKLFESETGLEVASFEGEPA